MDNLVFYQFSECGPVREINQDCVLSLVGEKASVFVVADGMGGYNEGEKASKAVIDAIQDWWSENPDLLSDDTIGNVSDFFENVISEVNKELYEYGLNKGVLGTTVSILGICSTKYFILSVGDSRIYRRRKREFGQLTVDEIWNNKWIIDSVTGRKMPDPKYGQLLNAVGTDKSVMVMKSCGYLESNTVFLLCSDGLYKFCDEKTIKKAMKYRKKAELEYQVKTLIDEVRDNGEKDNLSLIILRIDDVRP